MTLTIDAAYVQQKTENKGIGKVLWLILWLIL